MRREPDWEGDFGKAWKSRVENREDTTGVTTWIVHSSQFHQVWNHWVVAAVSLEDKEGVEPAYRQYPEAEHEIFIAALNPEVVGPDGPDPDEQLPPGGFLTPLDLVYQTDGLTDDQIAEVVSLMVRYSVVMGMSLDSDHRETWTAILNKTTRHYREGKHE